jgi:hypothetical protein
MFDTLAVMTDEEYRDTPEYRAWEAENARRSQAMTNAGHAIQGKDEAETAEAEVPEEG